LIPGQALHAKTLGFEHPHTLEWMQFDSELPEGYREILRKWEIYTKGYLS
jgi:23S rRNA pseudouridine1911/1915/1917 synthase